jgi:predicted cobalt transporter CbtA
MTSAMLDKFLLLTLLCASEVAGVPSPESLHSSITTLITNDLQGQTLERDLVAWLI